MKHIELTKGMKAIVDDDDYEFLLPYVWCAQPTKSGGNGIQRYYASTRTGFKNNSRMLLMHRLLMGNTAGIQVDHRNRDSLDNRRENLRLCTPTQNGQNSVAKFNTYKGAGRKGKRYRSRIVINGKDVNLGSWETEVDAARAYDVAAMEYFKEFARLNFTLDMAEEWKLQYPQIIRTVENRLTA